MKTNPQIIYAEEEGLCENEGAFALVRMTLVNPCLDVKG